MSRLADCQEILRSGIFSSDSIKVRYGRVLRDQHSRHMEQPVQCPEQI